MAIEFLQFLYSFAIPNMLLRSPVTEKTGEKCHSHHGRAGPPSLTQPVVFLLIREEPQVIRVIFLQDPEYNTSRGIDHGGWESHGTTGGLTSAAGRKKGSSPLWLHCSQVISVSQTALYAPHPFFPLPASPPKLPCANTQRQEGKKETEMCI